MGQAVRFIDAQAPTPASLIHCRWEHMLQVKDFMKTSDERFKKISPDEINFIEVLSLVFALNKTPPCPPEVKSPYDTLFEI